MSNDIKPVAMSIAQAAKAWSVSRGSAYAIIRANPWIRVIKIHGTKRAIPYEDVASYVSRRPTLPTPLKRPPEPPGLPRPPGPTSRPPRRRLIAHRLPILPRPPQCIFSMFEGGWNQSASS
jgi:hypothetical protein